MTKITFTAPEDFDAEKHWYNVFWKQYNKNAEIITLVFDPEYEDELKNWDNVNMKKLSSGKIEISIKTLNPEWLKRFVLSNGSHVKVKKPKWLKDAIIAEAKTVCKMYE